MAKLTRNDLFSLEKYSEVRADFRNTVLQHKKHRRIEVGLHANIYFEDKLTIQYQIQEILRVEKIFESSEIEEEIAAYNPLIPDGSNWKATFMLEYTDENERKTALAQLVGIEHKIWVKIGGHEKVFAIADEDLERSTENKTSAVHFLRFELSETMITALQKDQKMSIGIDHPNYQTSIEKVAPSTVENLLQDLNTD